MRRAHAVERNRSAFGLLGREVQFDGRHEPMYRQVVPFLVRGTAPSVSLAGDRILARTYPGLFNEGQVNQ